MAGDDDLLFAGWLSEVAAADARRRIETAEICAFLVAQDQIEPPSSRPAEARLVGLCESCEPKSNNRRVSAAGWADTLTGES